MIQGTDHRLKYFKPEQLEFVDGLIPVLEQEGLSKESKRLSSCGRKYNTFTCTQDDGHPHAEFAFPYRCELRVCPRCLQIRGNQVRKESREILKTVNKTRTHKFSLLTLTLKQKEEQLSADNLRDFNKKVRKLINYYYPKKKDCGAMSVMEIGPNMNIHAHVLVYGPYISQQQISKKWLAITGDSYIVDVRIARDQGRALSYITKYLLKPPTFEEPAQYVDFLKALNGVRRLAKYGIFYGVRLELRETCKCPYCGSSIKYQARADYENIDHLELYWEISKKGW